jgi:2-dehydro-3-deoxyphosphogluconate aldolase / (4S)-4-hydroxy-2-oxoglutarate aldolase
MDLLRFEKLPLIGIMRGIRSADVPPLAECCLSAGLETLEITMNTDGAAEMIRHLKNIAGATMMIGAGTVTNKGDLLSALEAGASFIVSPCFIEEIVDYCCNHSIPVFPGALTPGEIFKAWTAGATMVKVFPSSVFGHTYFKEIKAPFNLIKLMATGGVNPQNVGDFFSSGASAVAFGASIFKNEWMQTNQFEKIETGIKDLINAFKSWKAKQLLL